MPKLFASDVVLQDRHGREGRVATIKVNEPFPLQGVNIFQSSFEDGGSLLKVKALAHGRARAASPLDIRGRVQVTPCWEAAAARSSSWGVVDLRPTSADDLLRPSAAMAPLLRARRAESNAVTAASWALAP